MATERWGYPQKGLAYDPSPADRLLRPLGQMADLGFSMPEHMRFSVEPEMEAPNCKYHALVAIEKHPPTHQAEPANKQKHMCKGYVTMAPTRNNNPTHPQVEPHGTTKALLCQ